MNKFWWTVYSVFFLVSLYKANLLYTESLNHWLVADRIGHIGVCFNKNTKHAIEQPALRAPC